LLYKKYGKTGKDISIIGFGGMRFQKDGEEYDLEKCAQMVTRAYELGINYFDTAPGYCGGKSEEIFGIAFKQIPGKFYVSTKSSARTGDKLREDLERSLKRMGVEKIDFFHIWCVLTMEDYRKRLVQGGPYEAALKAKEEGLVEHITISTHCNGEEIETIVKEGLFEGITLGYNILNFPYRRSGLKAAFDNGMGVATMNPLGGGVIPQNAEYLKFMINEEDQSIVESAIKFNASHKEITTVLTGMSSLRDVEENAAVGNKISPFTEEKLKEIENKLSASMNELCTGCRYCEKCPQGVSIPKFMLAYNESLIRKDKTATMNALKWTYGLSPKEANECIACGACEKKCTQHLNIIERLKEIYSWSN